MHEKQNFMNGILFTKISDHFPIFHCNEQILDKGDVDCFTRRKIYDITINTFKSKLIQADWSNVLLEEDPQSAYDVFHAKYITLYNSCFPHITIKKGYKTRKSWLTDGLKKSINHKNNLYCQLKKRPTLQNELDYNAYKIKLNKILNSAERKFYHDQLEDHKGNLKRFWQITKSIINKNRSKPLQSVFKSNEVLIEDGEIITEHFNIFL